MQDNFTTDRLALRGMSQDDSAFITALVNTSGWLTFIGDRNIRTLEEGRAYVQNIIEKPNVHYWVVSLRNDATAIGIITFIKRDYLPHWDIGFAFLPEYGGNGYARESAACILESHFMSGRHEKILATTLPHNTSSIRLLEKLGFIYSRDLQNDDELLSVYSHSADKFQIDNLTTGFYGLFDNVHSLNPGLDKILSVCSAHALFVKKDREGETFYTLDSFLAPRMKLLSDGTLRDFKEWETTGETKIGGNLAHRFSSYRKSGVRGGNRFEAQGRKLFQYIRCADGWKITSVMWEDDD